jgi:CheY-like chemotaxis protein
LKVTFKPIADEKQLDFVPRIEDGVPATFHSDPTRLQQVLKNLLSNALKFTEKGGVSLCVRRAADGRLAFEVKDTGIGIASDKHDVIFEAFRQADGTTNRKYGGTGLGLSISRDLTRLLGGEMTLESTPGRGSTFTLYLPERMTAPAPEVAPREPRFEPRPSRPPHAPSTRTPRPPAIPDDRGLVSAGVRAILIIEDDPNFARILSDLAHELDFKTIVASTAEDGVEMAERYRPTAIVLDVGLPDRSGLTVLDLLKHNSATRHIPVHVCSGSDYRQVALAMGATGYAIKPVQREQLREAFRLLESKATQALRRVLVVEDDANHREATCRLLGADNVETVAAESAEAALEALEASTFDCMVLDLTLPDRTGFELLEEMSRKDRYSFPPVIVYTGRALSSDEEQGLRRLSHSIIIKGARSPERLLDEVTLFLHQVESELPPERQRMLRDVRHREAVFEGRRVLIVEDDVRNIFALTSVLEPKGAKIEIARNGREALTLLKDKPGIDLVLMDIMMPEMDGLEAMREIRKQPALSKLPIIALTAKAMADDREECLEAGANDYIAKPVDVDKLLSLARVWMAK